MSRAAWIAAIADTEDACAVALRARDRLAMLETWLRWQMRRGRVNETDGAAALADIAAARAAVQLVLDATRAHRGALAREVE